MPYSSKIFDSFLRDFFLKVKPLKILDIGAGAGKYGKLAKSISPLIETVAIEIWKPYINNFTLNNIYDVVINKDASELIGFEPDITYDLVIFGDSIEHLKKSIGIDLINYYLYRSKFILIIFPICYLQNSIYGNPHEAHISVWQRKDFDSYFNFYLEKEDMALTILAGFVEQKSSSNTLLSFKRKLK